VGDASAVKDTFAHLGMLCQMGRQAGCFKHGPCNSVRSLQHSRAHHSRAQAARESADGTGSFWIVCCCDSHSCKQQHRWVTFDLPLCISAHTLNPILGSVHHRLKLPVSPFSSPGGMGSPHCLKVTPQVSSSSQTNCDTQRWPCVRPSSQQCAAAACAFRCVTWW
jgi:hypothetical protein